MTAKKEPLTCDDATSLGNSDGHVDPGRGLPLGGIAPGSTSRTTRAAERRSRHGLRRRRRPRSGSGLTGSGSANACKSP